MLTLIPYSCRFDFTQAGSKDVKNAQHQNGDAEKIIVCPIA